MQSVCSCEEKTLCWQSLLFIEANYPSDEVLGSISAALMSPVIYPPPTAAGSRA